jgi:hypothetical protein
MFEIMRTSLKNIDGLGAFTMLNPQSNNRLFETETQIQLLRNLSEHNCTFMKTFIFYFEAEYVKEGVSKFLSFWRTMNSSLAEFFEFVEKRNIEKSHKFDIGDQNIKVSQRKLTDEKNKRISFYFKELTELMNEVISGLSIQDFDAFRNQFSLFTKDMLQWNGFIENTILFVTKKVFRPEIPTEEPETKKVKEN